MPPRFTIAIPTYNRGGTFLPQAVECALQQSFTNFELIISDNGSTDQTEHYASGLGDPRIRYIRRDKTVPSGQHFAMVTAAASGEFIVLHQDDDLLHRDFLARADAAFHVHPEAHMYAAPIWRQVHGHGYHARLMRPQHGHDDLALARDALLVFDGNYAAIQFFDPIRHFVHPTLAIRRDALIAVGGFDPGPDYQTDLVTQARVLIGNSLLYDPRPGGVSRVHATNFMRTQGRSFRKRFFRNSYIELIAVFERAHLDWQSLLEDYLSRLSEKEIIACLFEWTYYRAPLPLQKIGFSALYRKSGSTARFVRQCIRKVGVRNMLRHLLSCIG